MEERNPDSSGLRSDLKELNIRGSCIPQIDSDIIKEYIFYMIFHPLSLIITLLVLIPNIAFSLKQPVNKPSNLPKENIILAVIENIGRYGVFIIPLFYAVDLSGAFEIIAISLMGVMLLIYYVCWIRYFLRGNEFKWMFLPLMRIPIPLAISPVLYFMLSSVILHSIPMLIFSLLLAAGHILISWQQYKHIQTIN